MLTGGVSQGQEPHETLHGGRRRREGVSADRRPAEALCEKLGQVDVAGINGMGEDAIGVWASPHGSPSVVCGRPALTLESRPGAAGEQPVDLVGLFARTRHPR